MKEKIKITSASKPEISFLSDLQERYYISKNMKIPSPEMFKKGNF